MEEVSVMEKEEIVEKIVSLEERLYSLEEEIKRLRERIHSLVDRMFELKISLAEKDAAEEGVEKALRKERDKNKFIMGVLITLFTALGGGIFKLMETLGIFGSSRIGETK